MQTGAPSNHVYVVGAMAIIVSCVINAILNYFWIFRLNKRSKKSDVERELASRASAINELYSRHTIQTPYGFHLRIPEDEYGRFNPKVAAFLNQLNLLRIVFFSQDILDKQTIASHIAWAKFMLAPWIRSDEQLLAIWDFFKGNDLAEDFVTWAEKFIDDPTNIRKGKPITGQA